MGRPGEPDLSRLVFSAVDGQGREQDGSLYAQEIHELDLPADLVELSACRTALGQEIHGEGLVGLTQSFFEAGAALALQAQSDEESSTENTSGNQGGS